MLARNNSRARSARQTLRHNKTWEARSQALLILILSQLRRVSVTTSVCMCSTAVNQTAIVAVVGHLGFKPMKRTATKNLPQHICFVALGGAGLQTDLINFLEQGLWQSAQLVAGKPAFEMFAPSALGRAQVLVVNKMRPIAQPGTKLVQLVHHPVLLRYKRPYIQ